MACVTPYYGEQPQLFQQPPGGGWAPYSQPISYYGQLLPYQYPPGAPYLPDNHGSQEGNNGCPPSYYGYPLAPPPQQQQQQQSVVIFNAGVQQQQQQQEVVQYACLSASRFGSVESSSMLSHTVLQSNQSMMEMFQPHPFLDTRYSPYQ